MESQFTSGGKGGESTPGPPEINPRLIQKGGTMPPPTVSNTEYGIIVLLNAGPDCEPCEEGGEDGQYLGEGDGSP